MSQPTAHINSLNRPLQVGQVADGNGIGSSITSSSGVHLWMAIDQNLPPSNQSWPWKWWALRMEKSSVTVDFCLFCIQMSKSIITVWYKDDAYNEWTIQISLTSSTIGVLQMIGREKDKTRNRRLWSSNWDSLGESWIHFGNPSYQLLENKKQMAPIYGIEGQK